jgi:hypothetical protein
MVAMRSPSERLAGGSSHRGRAMAVLQQHNEEEEGHRCPCPSRRRLRKLLSHTGTGTGGSMPVTAAPSASQLPPGARTAAVPACHRAQLLHPHVLAQFDPQQFARDGLWIWEGALTPRGCRAIRDACLRVQRLNDGWNEHDWQKYDWEALGLRTPRRVDAEVISRARGGGQLGADGTQGSGINAGGLQSREGIRAPLGPGFKPEGCALAWDRDEDWSMMNLVTHPQMLQAHRKMLGPCIRFDHNTILLRKEGFQGQGWHSHDYYDDDHLVWEGDEKGYAHTRSGGGPHSRRDLWVARPGSAAGPGGGGGGGGGGSLSSDDGGAQHMYGPHRGRLKRCGSTDLGLVRTLIYPDGFRSEGDGGVKLVPGGHLQRSFLNPRTLTDAQFTRAWLSGRTHTGVPGEPPLTIYRPAVPPGSMVSICHHMPHAVSPRWEGRGTRICTLFSYRAPDPQCKIFSPTFTGMVPWELEEEATAGLIPGIPAERPNLFSCF